VRGRHKSYHTHKNVYKLPGGKIWVKREPLCILRIASKGETTCGKYGRTKKRVTLWKRVFMNRKKQKIRIHQEI